MGVFDLLRKRNREFTKVKMFYTLEQTKRALGATDERIMRFIHVGALRKFRDGPRLMFKADQVEALCGELGKPDSTGSDSSPNQQQSIKKISPSTDDYRAAAKDLKAKLRDATTAARKLQEMGASVRIYTTDGYLGRDELRIWSEVSLPFNDDDD